MFQARPGDMKRCLKNPQNKIIKNRDGVYKRCGYYFIWYPIQHDPHSAYNSFCLNFFFSPELGLRPEPCVLSKKYCTSESYPKTEISFYWEIPHEMHTEAFVCLLVFLNVIAEPDNLWDCPWYEKISFPSLGVGQDLLLFLMQTQDQGLRLQTYLYDCHVPKKDF